MSARGLRTLLSVGALILASVAHADAPSLTLYVYDSFAAKGGLGPEIFPAFEKKCGCKLKVLPSGDGGQLLSRLQIDAERGKPQAQIVVGLDEPTFARARAFLEGPAELKGWEPAGHRELHSDLKVALKKLPGFFPYDYGYFAFMADRETLSALKLSAPAKFSDLLKPEWKRKLILEDPRTSTPGLAFALYAGELAASSEKDFWPRMRTQWLTLSTGWDGAYGLFLRKEAPLVWSYTTSQAYHEEHGDAAASRRYFAVLFDEGQPMQIEGSALVKGAFASGDEGKKQRKLAQEFLEWLISPEVQGLVPRHNWMYPARKTVAIPPSFEHVPRPKKVVHLKTDAPEVSGALSRWSQAVEGAR